MKIAIITDAWLPQTNGVVRTLGSLKAELERMGHTLLLITPDKFTTIPLPTYAEIRLAIAPGWTVDRELDDGRPDAIHIATEGPLGYAARSYCRRRGVPFTTSFHTRFPEYIESRFGFPSRWTWELLRRFHAPAAATMVSTETIRRELEGFGFEHLKRWTRGVDHRLFKPAPDASIDLPRPVFLYVGRLAVEKNLPAFLDLTLPGTKLVVGDGPERAALEQRYPGVHFMGLQQGEDLAGLYALGDVFVFPSLTDTFGLVMLEALACGVPVAAFPAPGPLDVIADSGAGVLDWDLGRAAIRALDIDRTLCRERALAFSWSASATQFLDNLAPIGRAAGQTA